MMRAMLFKVLLAVVACAGLAAAAAPDEEAGERLSLEEAMRLAAEGNVDLAVKAAEVRGAARERALRRSALWPRVIGNAEYARIDADRARRTFGIQPREKTAVGIGASQVLYDDETVTAFRAAGRALAGEEYDAESVRLDVIARAGRRFLDFVEARALWRIEAENLKLTEENLALARVRHEVGTAGPEDVYRWESQEAEGKRRVRAAAARVEQARVALNQTLAVEPRRRWRPGEMTLADDEFYFLDDETMRGLAGSPEGRARFRAFSVRAALENSPNLKSLDKAIEARRLVLAQRKRSYYMPSLVARVDYDHFLDRRDEVSGTLPAGVSPESLDDEEWVFSVGAELPLFEGGGRAHEVGRAEADLARLREERERVRQLTEEEVLGAIYAFEGSHPALAYTRLAADRAEKNLGIVRDKYGEGTASIIELLDAQNEAFRQNQAVVLAVHNYLRDLVRYERAIAWFDKLAAPEERARWSRALRDCLRGKHGAGPARQGEEE